MSHSSKKFVSADCLFLVCVLVCQKMPMTIRRYCRTKGRKAISKEQHDVAEGGIRLHRRFLTGDYRATYEELQSLLACCQMVSDLHHESYGMSKKIANIALEPLIGAEGDLLDGAYGEVMRQVDSGVLERVND